MPSGRTLPSHLFSVRRPLKCPECPATFTTPALLRYHQVVHTKNYQYACTLCDRTFTRKFSRDKHVREHNAFRRHQCKYCDQSFFRQAGLRNHIGIHTGEQPFGCGLCPLRFRYSYAASHHRRAVHLVDGQYRCERCGYAVDTLPVFKVHLLGCPPQTTTTA